MTGLICPKAISPLTDLPGGQTGLLLRKGHRQPQEQLQQLPSGFFHLWSPCAGAGLGLGWGQEPGTEVPFPEGLIELQSTFSGSTLKNIKPACLV